MTLVRFAPDRLCPLGLQRLESDSVHRRDGGQLHQAFGLHIAELRGDAGERIESRYEESGGAFTTRELGHHSNLRGGIGRSSPSVTAQSRAWHRTGPKESLLRNGEPRPDVRQKTVDLRTAEGGGEVQGARREDFRSGRCLVVGHLR